MLRVERSTPDFLRIRNDQDRKYYLAGIPSEFWNAPKAPFRFRTFKLAEDVPVVNTFTQDAFWTKLQDPDQTAILRKPHLVFVCIDDHESRAMALAFEVAKRALSVGMTIQVDNAAMVHPPADVMDPLAVLVNVTDDGTLARREQVRDWIHTYAASFRLVCIAGSPDKAVTFLRERPSIVFYLSPHLQVQA